MSKTVKLILIVKALFFVAIADTFLTEWLQKAGFFDDTNLGYCAHQAWNCFDGNWYWGWRHCLWFWSNVIVFVITAINTFVWFADSKRK